MAPTWLLGVFLVVGPMVAQASSINPCSAVSASSKAFLDQHPKATSVSLKPSDLRACIEDVPIDKDLAARQIEWIKNFVQFQTTLAFLKDPTPEYELPPVDIMGGLTDISSKAIAGAYQGEYEFERDIFELICHADDSHFGYLPYLIRGVEYTPGLAAASISLDGVALPKVYLLADIQAKYGKKASFTPSAIRSVNGVNIDKYLGDTNYLTLMQDLDAQYNTQFYNPATALKVDPNAGGLFLLANPDGMAKDANDLVFENGTQRSFPAKVTPSFPLKYQSGQELFDDLLVPSTSMQSSSATSSTAAPSSTSAPKNTSTPLTPPGTGFPKPVMKHNGDFTSGYFLSGEPDVAVLVISSFDAVAETPEPKEFQDDIRSFLEKCRSSGKQRLIIDVRGNGGGTSLLGYDTFKQLFPSKVPYSGNRVRLPDAANILGQLASDSSTQRTLYLNTSFYDAHNELKKPDGAPFRSWNELAGPVKERGDAFSEVGSKDFGNIKFDEQTGGIVVSGYGPSNETQSQPFKSENIILLTDGACSSTCAIFANLLINQGNVHTATAGGRPETKPMAVIGGTQGGEVFSYVGLKATVQAAITALTNKSTTIAIEGGKAAALAVLSPLIKPAPIKYYPNPKAPSVNLIDNVAQGDTSVTPLQFTKSPVADCRFFYMPEDILSVEYTWTRLIKGFGKGGKGLCVGGGGFGLKVNGTTTTVPTATSQSTSTSTGSTAPFEAAAAGIQSKNAVVLALCSALCAMVWLIP